MNELNKVRVKWSFEEEFVLAEYFLCCKEEGCEPNEYSAYEVLCCKGFKTHDVSKVKAKLNDLWKIERGKDISHVSYNTIKAYRNVDEELQIPNIIIETLNQNILDFNTFRVPKYFATGFCPRILTLEDQQVVANILDFPHEPSFCELLERFINRLYIDSKGKKTWTHVYQSVDIDHESARQIRKGKRLKLPNLYRLIFGLELSYAEADKLLSKAKIFLGDLDSLAKRIVVQCLRIPVNNKRIINEAFLKLGEPPLFPFFEEKMQQGQEIKRRYTE